MTTALPLPVISTARHPGTPGALERAASGAAVGGDDAEILLQARGGDLDLSDVEELRRLVRAGIDEWGGVSP